MEKTMSLASTPTPAEDTDSFTANLLMLATIADSLSSTTPAPTLVGEDLASGVDTRNLHLLATVAESHLNTLTYEISDDNCDLALGALESVYDKSMMAYIVVGLINKWLKLPDTIKKLVEEFCESDSKDSTSIEEQFEASKIIDEMRKKKSKGNCFGEIIDWIKENIGIKPRYTRIDSKVFEIKEKIRLEDLVQDLIKSVQNHKVKPKAALDKLKKIKKNQREQKKINIQEPSKLEKAHGKGKRDKGIKIDEESIIERVSRKIAKDEVKINTEGETKIIMVGLVSLGKSTVLAKLGMGEILKTVLTPDFHVESVKWEEISIFVWDVGTECEEKDQQLWRSYLPDTSGVIFVMDGNNPSSIGEAKMQLHKLMKEN